MNNPINSLLYIKISSEQSENMQGIDFSIPLPVQLPENTKKEDFKPENITPEMILAGMLLVFAYDRENINIDRYRQIFSFLRPNIRKEMMQAAIIKIKNGDFDMAEEILLSLEGLNPVDTTVKLNLALLMEERASFFDSANIKDKAGLYTEKAAALYNVLIAAEPPFPEAFFNAAYFFISQNNYFRGKSLLETYLQIETSQSETSELRKEKAEKMLQTISEQCLDNELFQKAYDFINKGQEDKAAETIKLFLRQNPKIWKAWFLLGWALRKLQRWEDAKAAFLQSLSLIKEASNDKTSFCSILNELSICFMELSNFAEAEKQLFAALSRNPDDIKTISNLGTLALKQGRKEEAEGYFRTVLEINPNDEIALHVLGLKADL